MAGRAGQAISRSSGLEKLFKMSLRSFFVLTVILFINIIYKHSQHSGLADHHPLLGESQEPSLELSSLESNAIRFCEIMKKSQHISTQPCSSNVSSSGMEMGSQLGANSLIDEQL